MFLHNKYIIKNGLIVDGTGSPGYKADILVCGEKIESIGSFTDKYIPVVDANERVVAPGFIELHTHYDPHIFWDKYLSPAPEHGVTTVVTGNCSISLAPIRNGGDLKVTNMFKRIEDLDPEVFSDSVPYNWNNFSEYLDSYRSVIGINVGALIGHTTLRHFVMGEDAQRRNSSPYELEEMCEEVRNAVNAGALGLSMSYDHVKDENNFPVSSSFSSYEEKVALATTLVSNGRNLIQCTINPIDIDRRMEQLREMGQVSKESGASILILGIMENPITGNHWRKEIQFVEDLNRSGASVYFETQVRPLDLNFQLNKSWIVSFYMPTWAEIMRLPVNERYAKFKDRPLRGILKEEANLFSSLMDKVLLRSAKSDKFKEYEGAYLIDIAKVYNTSIIDTMLDISVSENLETIFQWKDVIHANTEIVAEMLMSPLTKIAGSDAGAHITQFSGEGDSTYMLEHFVRNEKIISIEQAVKAMTSDIADSFSIKKRGRIQPGYFSDIVIFDPNKVARKKEEYIYDVPGVGGRYYRGSKGIDLVIVNGEIVIDKGKYSNNTPGKIV